RRLEALLAREAEARGDRELVGLSLHRGGEASIGSGGVDDRDRTAVEHLVARAAHDLGVDHAAFGVDGDEHGQLAVELLALVLREVARAAILDLAPQLVVVERVDLLARRRADVALLRPRILLVDALFDLGEHLDLAAAVFLLALLGRSLLAQRVGRRQQRELAPHDREELLLRLLQLLDLLSRVFMGVADFGQGRQRQRRRRAAGRRVAAAGEARLRDRLRLLGRFARARVDEDDVERRVLEHSVEAFGIDEAHAEQRAVDGERDAERDVQRRDLLRQRELHAGAATAGSASVAASGAATSTAIASGPALGSSSSSSLAGAGAADSMRPTTDAARSSVNRSI